MKDETCESRFETRISTPKLQNCIVWSLSSKDYITSLRITSLRYLTWLHFFTSLLDYRNASWQEQLPKPDFDAKAPKLHFRSVSYKEFKKKVTTIKIWQSDVGNSLTQPLQCDLQHPRAKHNGTAQASASWTTSAQPLQCDLHRPAAKHTSPAHEITISFLYVPKPLYDNPCKDRKKHR